MLRYLDAVGARIEFAEDGPQVITLEELKRRAQSGQRNLERAGLAPSNPRARLAVKKRAGLDTTAEEKSIGQS